MYDPDLVIKTDIPASTQQALLDAAVKREALAAQWLCASQVSARFCWLPRSDGDRASQLRRMGKLLAVYVTCPEPSYRYPTRQFNFDGEPVEHLAEMLAVLRNCGPFRRESLDLRRTTGWGEVE